MAGASTALHVPVMLDEMLAAVAPHDGEVIVDATFGAGGYSRALLTAAECSVHAIDRDPDTEMLAEALARDFPGLFFYHAGAFGEMRELLTESDVSQVDAIVMDVGVSSMQIDQGARGFSFMQDGPLDMRMAQSGQSAADVVNGEDEVTLAEIFYRYGEEHRSRKVAKAIVEARVEAPIETTGQLASLIEKVLGKGKTHPATKVFQALRIYVNKELEQLEQALESSLHLLREGGRLVVVTFHSLEDRIVKQFMQTHAGEVQSGSRHDPLSLLQLQDATASFLKIEKRKAVKPSADEIARNPRARSAKLRVAVRTGVTMEAAA